MKKQIIVPMAIVLGISSFASAKTFSDVPNTYPAYVEAIDKLSEQSVISGYPDGTFKPSNTITRAEVSKMVVEAFNLKLNPQKDVTFTDIGGKWFEEYIKIAGSNDILHGYFDGTVKPNNPITYAELSAVLNRILNIHTSTVKEEGESWHTNSWKASDEIGLFDNVTTNDLIPDAKARRDNVALMLFNALNYTASANSGDEKKEEVTTSGEEVKQPEEKEKQTQDNKKEEQKTSSETKKEDEKQQTSTTTQEVDTNKIYFGIVDDKQLIRGRDTIDIDFFNGDDMTFTVKNFDDPPVGDELIFLKLRKSGSTNILKEIVVEDLNNAYRIESVDEDDTAKISGDSGVLDITDDDYTFGTEKVVFNKMNFYLIDVRKDKNEFYFKAGEELNIEDVSFEEDDRLIVDKSKKLFIIFRGLEKDDIIK